MFKQNLKEILAGLAVIIGGTLYTWLEIITDGEEISTGEFLMDSIEKSLIITGAAGVFLVLRRMKLQQDERTKLVHELEIARTEGREWRSKVQTYVNGVGVELDNQFQNWGLSEAENEVALLMVKGLSHKEIADLRGTAEATVRQQARSIYQKSGLPGKAAFTSYFLEDLLPPSQIKRVNTSTRPSAQVSALTEGNGGEDPTKRTH